MRGHRDLKDLCFGHRQSPGSATASTSDRPASGTVLGNQRLPTAIATQWHIGQPRWRRYSDLTPKASVMQERLRQSAADPQISALPVPTLIASPSIAG
jgi:hypothetical protein